ncbi:hypothetical protein BVG19_g5641 [[Candida] boidinii]|nr:hypothetical protein BVG19_g5641 [[Candida] boidinii]OWB50971.1 kinase activity protein [[Candida] boidinii]
MGKKEDYTRIQVLNYGRLSAIYSARRSTSIDHQDGDDNGNDSQNISDPTLYAIKESDLDDCVPPHDCRIELKILKYIKARLFDQYGEFNNKNLLELIDSYQTPFELGIVTRYYEFTLNSIIQLNTRQRSNFTGSGLISMNKINNLPVERGKSIFLGIINGLKFLHENGIIHRDINPNNIVFETIDSEPTIIDFGISFIKPDNFGQENFHEKICDVATSVYKAPELLLSIKNYSTPIDIWACGIIALLLFSKDAEIPFSSQSFHSDIALLATIFNTFGRPTIKTWPEVKHSSSFQNLNKDFIPDLRKSSTELLPKLNKINDSKWFEVFDRMMIYQSGDRATAADILKCLRD